MELMATCLEKLQKRLKQPIPERILGKVTVATVRALHFLKEEHGVIHRGKSIENVFLANILIVTQTIFYTFMYLAFTSHHPLHQKMGVARTLLNRCKEIVTRDRQRERERHNQDCTEDLRLPRMGHSTGLNKSMREKESNKKKDNSRKEEEKNKGMVVLPYVSGVSEKLARIFKKRKISSAMKPS